MIVWTDAQTDILREKWGLYSASVIAALLNEMTGSHFSSAAVVGHARTIGLAGFASTRRICFAERCTNAPKPGSNFCDKHQAKPPADPKMVGRRA